MAAFFIKYDKGEGIVDSSHFTLCIWLIFFFFIQASLVCRSWLRLAFDEILWKNLFYRHWGIRRSIPMSPEKQSWVEEYKRLLYHTPCIESEVFKEHKDEVLHVSFSHNGKMFATTSKDSSVKVSVLRGVDFNVSLRSYTPHSLSLLFPVRDIMSNKCYCVCETA